MLGLKLPGCAARQAGYLLGPIVALALSACAGQAPSGDGPNAAAGGGAGSGGGVGGQQMTPPASALHVGLIGSIAPSPRTRSVT